MKKTVSALLIAGTILLVSGCLKAPFQPPVGTIYNDSTAPLSTEYNRTDIGTKKGSGHARSILGLFAWGDLSTQSAAKAAGISVIKHLDYEYFNFLFIVQTTTINVYGD